MKVNVESLSPVKKKLSISVPEETVLEEFNQAYRTLSKQAQVPGFRKGKVPRNILEKMYAGSVESQVYEALVRDTFLKALEQNELDAVAMPEITEPKREQGEGFSYVAAIEVKPKFEPKNYKGVKVTKPEAEPKDTQVDEVVKRLQDSHGVLKDREGATKPVKGDFVSLVIQGIDDQGNLTAPDAEPKEQLYEVGGEILHETVEKAVLKLSIGETAPVTVVGKVGMKEDPAKTEEKEIHVQVTLKGIKEKILPALNDEFAKACGPFETLAALTSRIKEDLTKELEQNGRAGQIEEILKTLAADNPVELPESLVDQEVHQLIHGFYGQMERQGIKEIPAEYSEEKLHEKLEPDAKRRVHEQLLIEAIARKENISVAEEELSKRLAEMAQASKIPVGEFRAYYEKTNRLGSVRFQILAQKTLDFLLSVATIK